MFPKAAKPFFEEKKFLEIFLDFPEVFLKFY